MYTLKLDAENKTMIHTSISTVYQGENLSDTLVFLIPQTVGDVVVENCKVYVYYLRPDGIYDYDELIKESFDYKEYHQYHFPVTSKFTASVGVVKLSLQLNSSPDIILKTGETTIEVCSPGDVADISSQISALYKLSKRIDDIEANKADNIFYNAEEKFIQLSASGNPIGDKLSTSDISDDGDEVIDFDQANVIVPDSEDEVIRF